MAVVVLADPGRGHTAVVGGPLVGRSAPAVAGFRDRHFLGLHFKRFILERRTRKGSYTSSRTGRGSRNCASGSHSLGLDVAVVVLADPGRSYFAVIL